MAHVVIRGIQGKRTLSYCRCGVQDPFPRYCLMRLLRLMIILCSLESAELLTGEHIILGAGFVLSAVVLTGLTAPADATIVPPAVKLPGRAPAAAPHRAYGYATPNERLKALTVAMTA